MKRPEGTALGALMLAPWMAAWAQERPNILFILCDDMGWGDLGCYGQHYIRTPHIDRLAHEGMQFMQAYAGSPVSAPSRASLMTGQHSGHCAVRGNKEYWNHQNTVRYGENVDFARVGQHPLDTAHVVIPEILKAAGYRTAQFGKWAGGYEGSESTPDRRGIDEFFGYICQFQAHLYYPNFLNDYRRDRGDEGVSREVYVDNFAYPMYGPEYRLRTVYSADTIHRRALDWLDRQTKDQPFYGLFTYTLPHAELVQPEDSILNDYKRQFAEDKTFRGQEASRYNPVTHTHAEFAGMITRLDAYVGEIMAKLEEKGLADNTVLIFSSDNGPHEEGGADPTFFNRDGVLKGLKRSCHEGGIRIPFIVRWPGHVAEGVKSQHPIAFWDLMPTFAELAGVENYVDRYRNPRLGERDYFDGISFLPALLGRDCPEHEYLYWEFHETNQIAVRKGDWKLIVKNGRSELYNLADDVHEDHDLAAQQPEKTAELEALVRQAHTENPLFRVTLPGEKRNK
ncbi:MAG: arylsulfatase [Bacteroidaceae bacterium]|nr:arylsulfatase [Bacteroidaceae bacterium]